MNPDFVEMLSALSDEGAEFLIVGAYALATHGVPRSTGDIDLWVHPSRANAEKVWAALIRFGAPMLNLTRDDLAVPGVVFQIGLPPRRIDFLTSIDGVEFGQAWARRTISDVGGVSVGVLSREDLIQNKRASGRPQDLADVARLEEKPE